MDAHLFRRIAHELPARLTGLFLEKIHAPCPDVSAITLHGREGKCFLVMRHSRQKPVLYLSRTRPLAPTGPHPADSRVMLLRKHMKGRRIHQVEIDWPLRRIALHLHGEGIPYVILDLRAGIQLKKELPDAFGHSPEPIPADWPNSQESEELTHGTLPEARRAASVLTPPLWRACSALFRSSENPEDGRAEIRALLADLEDGQGDIFLYRPAQGQAPCALSAWPVAGAGAIEENRADILEALAEYGDALVGSLMAQTARAEHEASARAGTKRLKRLISKLGEEEKRLENMIAGQEKALLIKANLHALDHNARLAEVVLPAGPLSQELRETTTPGEPAAEAEDKCRIRLDPRLTVRENMERLFHHAARGKRGQVHLAERLAKSREELAALERQPTPLPFSPKKTNRGTPQKAAHPVKKAGAKDVSRQISAFISSDGLTVLRGRNAQGNAALMHLSVGHDYWLHAQDGPSAHVLIRRDHPRQPVPEQSLREAAVLCANKSAWSNDASANIIVALAKDVRAVKGAHEGAASVREVLCSLSVTPDAALEERLTANPAAPKNNV